MKKKRIACSNRFFTTFDINWNSCSHFEATGSWPTATVIPVFITGRQVITKWGNYSTFNIAKLQNTFQNNSGNVKCTLITPFCDNGMPHYENGNQRWWCSPRWNCINESAPLWVCRRREVVDYSARHVFMTELVFMCVWQHL